MKAEPSNPVGQLRRILESSLYADNLDRAEAFYRDVLGLELTAREYNRHLFFRCGNQMLLIFNPATTIQETDTPHGARGPGHIAFSMPLAKLDQWKSYLNQRGVEIERDVVWSNGGRSLYFRDPAGNCLELATPLVWGMAEDHLCPGRDIAMNQPDEFYIGWEDRAPPSVRSRIRRVVVVIFLLATGVGALMALSQRTIGVSAFEWGKVKIFSGIMEGRPYPHLLVPRPGDRDGLPHYSTYYLVARWKFGLKPEEVAPFEGKPVTIRGTLIYRGNQTMIETQPNWISSVGEPSPAPRPGQELISLGRQTLIGEIVDSKCYLGVMNPGQLAPHRACAIRCISGGVPPVLVVRQKEGPPLYLLLVSADGRQVNDQVLDFVAEPMAITGEVLSQGEWLILRADPSTYRRVTNR